MVLALIRTLGAFFQHLNKHGLRAPKHLTDTEAQEEAIWFLEQHYRGEEVQGFEGAYLDVLSGNLFGLKDLLDKITAIKKSLEREKYISSVLTGRIDPSNWQLRTQLAGEYICRYGRFWPEQVQNYHSYLLAYSVEELLKLHASTTPT